MEQIKPEAPTAPDRLVAAPKTTKMVKVRAIRDFRHGPGLERERKVAIPGQEVEVTEEEAKNLCDKTYEGSHAFYGERQQSEVQRHVIRRAERVA